MNQVIARVRSVESCRPLSPDERLAQWASRFYGEGHHRGRALDTELDEEPESHQIEDMQ